MLIDNHHRKINYLRLSVTDRCNLRCSYCMPADAVFVKRKELLTDGEILRLARLLSGQGVSKIRITGGEPFARPGLTDLLGCLKELDNIESISLTTNGILALPHMDRLAGTGIKDINLSLDTLQRERFLRISGRDHFDRVWEAFQHSLALGMRIKLNVVVLEDLNTDEILDFASLTALYPVSVRFIEEMPFNGKGKAASGVSWHYRRILDHLRSRYTLAEEASLPGATAVNYQIPGHPGTVGVIPAYSRTFCGTCNRLRITSTGGMKTCLYGEDVLNVRDLMRAGFSDQELLGAVTEALGQRHANGWEAAEARHIPLLESMSVIGG